MEQFRTTVLLQSQIPYQRNLVKLQLGSFPQARDLWGHSQEDLNIRGDSKAGGWKHLEASLLSCLVPGAFVVSQYLWPLPVASASFTAWQPQGSQTLTGLLWAPSVNVLENKVEATCFFIDQVLEVTHDHICCLLLATNGLLRPVEISVWVSAGL